MSASEISKFQGESAEYLEQNEVYFILHDMMKALIRYQPREPIRYLIDRLSSVTPLVICVFSPPGCERKRLCTELASQYNCSHVHVGELLAAKHAEDVKYGRLVNDGDVIEVVKEALSAGKGSQRGWILNGFPRTKVQARALQNMRVIPDHVVLIKGDEPSMRANLLQKVAPLAADPEKRLELVESRLQQYFRHIHTTTEIFKTSVLEVDMLDADRTALEQVDHAISRTAGDPRGPLRVCVTGPLGSGRSTQSALVAQAFGVVHVDVNAMCQSTKETPTECYSDEELCDIVGKRLKQTDCQRRGWVLDGFPNTKGQAEFLRKAHLWPSRVINLSITESVCLQRLSLRRVDPVTGEHYYGPPPHVSIRQRVVQAAADTPEHVSERYNFHADRVEAVLSQFKGCTVTLRANQDAAVLHHSVLDFVKLPLSAVVAA